MSSVLLLTISLVRESVFQTVGKMKTALVTNYSTELNFISFCFEVQAVQVQVQVQVDFLGFSMFQVVCYEVY